MKKRLLLVFLISVCLGLKVSAQKNLNNNSNQNVNSNSSEIKKSETLSDFPVYVNTGNPEQDATNYSNAKNEWIKNNPEKYAQINGGNEAPVLTKSTDDVNSQVNITKDQKDKWIVENSSTYYQVDQHKSNTETNESSDLHLINKSEFEIMPVEKRSHILAHPELYKIVE